MADKKFYHIFDANTPMISPTSISPVISAAVPKIRAASISLFDGGATKKPSKELSACSCASSRGRSSAKTSKGTLPVKMTKSMGNLSGLKCVLKKCIVKINPTAKSASSPWIMVAILMIHPGKNRVKNSGNQRTSPVEPMIATPQNTAK